MTAITAENTVPMEPKVLSVDGYYVDFEVAASTAIYKWSFVGLNATGYLTSAVAPTGVATASGAAPNGTRFIGIATEAVASQTADGDKRCRVMVEGYFEYTMASMDRVDQGSPVFLSDNATLTSTARTGPCVGHLVALAASNRGIIKLDPFLAQDAGKLLAVSSPALSMATANNKVLLVHETQNPTGLLLCTAAGYVTVAMVASAQVGTVTLQHTADTSLGCTLVCVDNMPVGDLLVGQGGQLWNGLDGTSPAQEDPIVIVPAGKQVNAEVTTANNESTSEAGSIVICATFMRV